MILSEGKYMSNGMRTSRFHILTDNEINIVKREIQAIGADLDDFVFNDIEHQRTCYYPENDKIYIAGDVLPDTKSASIHIRDLMSVRAVLAHEYYGHKPHREEYLRDLQSGENTIPRWQDEFRASYEAARYCPNLTAQDKYYLIEDAVMRATEAKQKVKNDGFMTEVVYGLPSEEEYYTEQPGVRYEQAGTNYANEESEYFEDN